MKIFGFPNTRSTRALWTLEEANASYEYVHVNLLAGEARKPPYLALNPSGKVPAMVDGDLTLTESGAICAYIADKFPTSKLAPARGTAERGRFDQWSFFALAELEQPLWTLSKHMFALPDKLRVPQIMDTARWEFSRAAEVLHQGLKDREFILDSGFSVADILLSNTLNWARMYRLEIAPLSVSAYAGRMLSRPAVARAVARERAASRT